MKQEKQRELSEIRIRQDYNREEKIQDFLRQIQDPYHFYVEDIEVTVSFAPDGEPLQAILEHNLEQMILLGLQEA